MEPLGASDIIATRLPFDHLAPHNRRSGFQMLYHLSTTEITHFPRQRFGEEKLCLCIILGLVMIFDGLQERRERNQSIPEPCLIPSVFEFCKVFAT